MTQQMRMEQMLSKWVITCKSLQVLENTLGFNSVSTVSMRYLRESLESILKNHGYVYRITTYRMDNSVYEVNYIFRRNKVKNFIKVHDNFLKKYWIGEWYSSEFKWVEL